MKDSNRTREQPMSDLVQVRKQVAELEASEAKRKVPDEAMAQSEMTYRALFEEALNPILVMDESGRYIDANPAALEFLECDRNELLGKEVWDFMPPGLSKQQKQEYSPFAGRRIVEMDYFIHGTTKTLLLNVVPLTLSGKTLLCAIGQDITERKRAWEALEESEERYHALFQDSVDGIFTVTREGKLVDANQAALDLFGYTGEDITKLQVQELYVNLADRERLQREIEQKAAMKDYELKMRKKDGTEIDCQVTATLWRAKDGSILGYWGIIRDITKRKRVEELYATLANSPQIGVYIVQDGKIQFANPYIQRYSGFSQDEVLGVESLSFVHPEDKELVRQNAIKMLKGDRSSPYEFRTVTKDGHIRWILERVVSIEYEGKKAALATHMDVTERKEAEELYRVLANSPQLGVYVLQDGKVKFANPYLREYFGFSKDEAIEVNPLDVVHPEDRQMVRENFLRMLKREQSSPFECRAISKTGQTRWITQVVTRIQCAGKPAILGNLMDITEQREARKRLEELEALESSILRAIPQAVIGLQERRIIFANDAVEDVFGWKPEELIGKDVRIIHRSDEAYRIAATRFYTTLEREQIYTGENIFRRKDGRNIVCLVRACRIDDALTGRRVVAALTDVTERKQYEEQLRAALKEKEELLSEVHHRVKNNLQVISSLLYLTGTRIDDQRAIGLLADARDKIHTMALIHSQLYRSERFARIKMAGHIEELVSYLAGLYAGTKKITALIEASEIDLSMTQAVPCSLVLNELISNAFKHAFKERQGGTIEISMQKSAQDMILMKVKDDGIGLPDEIDIYETDSLGLKLVRNLVEKQLNGKIQVERNRGTEFRVEFKILGEGAEYGQNIGSRR